MTIEVEVFADISCPFTHVGLKRVVQQLEPFADVVGVRVRAWPLEWVNGEHLDATAVAAKIDVLRDQLGVTEFAGFRRDRWPQTTLPALELAASAEARGSRTGLEVGLDIRDALFERGEDISDPAVLGRIADAHGLPGHFADSRDAVAADYADGVARGVRGSPDFWVGDEEFFCPSLELSRGPDGDLHADFDSEGLAKFIAGVVARI